MHPLSLGHSFPRPRERTGEPGVWEGAAVFPSARVVGMDSSVSRGGCRRIQCADRCWEGAAVGSARGRLNGPRAPVGGAAVEAGAHSCLWWVRATEILLEPHLARPGLSVFLWGHCYFPLEAKVEWITQKRHGLPEPYPPHTRALGVQLPWGVSPAVWDPQPGTQYEGWSAARPREGPFGMSGLWLLSQSRVTRTSFCGKDHWEAAGVLILTQN